MFITVMDRGGERTADEPGPRPSLSLLPVAPQEQVERCSKGGPPACLTYHSRSVNVLFVERERVVNTSHAA